MELGKFDKIKFGKYKGEAISTIMVNEPSYLDWCCKNIEGFKLNPEMECQLKEKMEETV